MEVSMKKKGLGLGLIACFIMAAAIIGVTGKNRMALGSDTPSGYYIKIGNDEKKDNSEYDMTSENNVAYPDVPISLVKTESGNEIPVTTEVEWETSQLSVAGLAKDLSTPPSSVPITSSSPITLVRRGPGFANITAKIGDKVVASRCIKVNLKFLKPQENLVSTTIYDTDMYFVLDESDKYKHIKLDYTDSASTPAVSWKSDKPEIVEVNKDTGELTPHSSGTAMVTVTTNTVNSAGIPLSQPMYVVVKPKFYLDLGTHPNPQSGENSLPEVNNVPTTFTLKSNAVSSENLIWKIIDDSTNKEISFSDHSKMTCVFEKNSGNVNFSNVKAGIYEIYAYPNVASKTNDNVPHASMKIMVPLVMDDNIVMGVTDTYNFLDNSNIASADMIQYPDDINYNESIVRVDKEKAEITAKAVGKKTITLHLPSQVVYGTPPEKNITITIIDGIVLSSKKETMYVGAEYGLIATTPDDKKPNEVTWTSSNKEVAEVDNDGKVTAKKKGQATITAKIKDDKGVVKTASCVITVKNPVTKITLKDDDVTLSIGELRTIVATIEPDDLDPIKLKWESSNESVVKVSKPYDTSAVIEATGSGRAVITAIDRNSVVVGYCHVVVKKPVESIVLNETNVTLNSSVTKLQLNATVYPEDATNKKVTWKSSDSSVATVNASGMVTINHFGKVTIIATSVDNPKVSELCNITIEVPVKSVNLDQTSKTMYAGDTTRLTYFFNPTNATNCDVTWSSSDPTVAVVDGTGKVTALHSGKTSIIIRSDDGGHTDYCIITVKQSASGIKLDTTKITISTGETHDFKPTLSPSGSLDTVLTWQSSDTRVASIDSNGRLTALASGIAVITVKTDMGATASCTVTVIQKASGLTLNPTEKTIYVGDKFDITATVTPNNASNSNVTFQSSNTKAATVSQKGEVVGVSGGVTVITCKAADGGYVATSVVTVKELITSVKLNHSSYRLGIHKTLQLKATVKSKSATNQKVTWTSSNHGVATVSQNGLVTGKSKGYATIKAKAKDGSGAVASCEIRVITAVSGIKLSKGYLSMLVGQSKSLKATIRPSNATYKSAKWISSNNKVALVSGGKVTALKAGSATITAQARDNSGHKAICYVTVRGRVPSTGVLFMDKTMSMVPGEEKTAHVTLNPAISTDHYTFSSDNTSVAKVNRKTGRITARATGTANVTVMTTSGKTASVEVIVVGLNMHSITLEQYTTYPYNLLVEGATSNVNWSIKNPQIGVLTQTGKNSVSVSSRGIGTTTITANVNGRKLSCKLKVISIK
jgi:uncharacterized protein YjdB